LLLAVLAAGVLLFVTLSNRGVVRVEGTQAGDLDAGSVIEQGFSIRRGGAFTVSAIEVENTGHAPVFIESVVPQSTSPDLRATPARIWVIPREAFTAKVETHYLNTPLGEGWPPKRIEPKPRNVPPLAWTSPPPVLLLPTREWVDPGREAELIYGVFLHGRPRPWLRVTALRITFKQGGQTSCGHFRTRRASTCATD
jgi:hypothetical protein